jgi:hypothetical protein
MGSELLLLRESIVVERSRCIEMVIVSRKKECSSRRRKGR